MARPRKKVTKQRVTLTISPSLLTMAQDHAYESGESLSGLVERLLRGVIAESDNEPTLSTVGSIAKHMSGGSIGRISVATKTKRTKVE